MFSYVGKAIVRSTKDVDAERVGLVRAPAARC